MGRMLLVLGSLLLNVTCFATQVDVFTTHTIGFEPDTLSNASVKVYYVDDFARINQKLNAHVQSNALLADEELNRSSRQYFNQHQASFLLASMAVLKAIDYGVQRIPAVVINGHYQIVGTTNVNTALNAYQSWRLNQVGAS